MFKKDFIEIVINSSRVTSTDLRSLASNKDEGLVTEFELLNIPGFNEAEFASRISRKYQIPLIDLTKIKISREIISLMSKRQILQFRAIPIKKEGEKIILIIFDPSVVKNKVELKALLRSNVEFAVTKISEWKKLFQEIRESILELVDSIEETKENDTVKEVNEDDIGQDVVQFVNKLLVESFVMKASDIHIESYEKAFRIRVRVDGDLVELASPSKHYQMPVVSRLKIMASMNIAERRLPQDGRIKLKIGRRPVDFRVSSLPTLFGEKIVLRILDQSNLQLDMTNLGFDKKQLKVFQNGIQQPYGMCLVVGPTGSGKTTTLYSALSEMNNTKKNLVTVEDPVEFNFEGINQVNVKDDIGLTFASALKSFLRQDPDIMMVGEIRNVEVGKMAIEAALTGHMVLSTLHTNDAPGTISRLLNMGIDPFLLVASLNVVTAQRLCKKICLHCKREISLPTEELVQMGFSLKMAPRVKTFEGEGCKRCVGTGYKGRVAIYEVLPISKGIRKLIMKRASSDELKDCAIEEGMKTLRMAALMKVAQGLIPVEEALSNSASDKK
ncbi:MAG: ATPase, T2SS/T4P/T4SS family [Bacteriovoracales bacterium]|nr:ATPase, T2SS/T4P/T4SS family [Bacteriovoracales bacterium]